MKRLNLTLAIVLLGTTVAMAAGTISKQAAETDAVKAVGGGSVIQAVLDTNAGLRVWSVDILGSTHEYEVWVNAKTGAIVKIITQPLASSVTLLSKAQAEQDALNAVGGGQVLQAALDSVGKNTRAWSVDILGTAHEYEVWVNATNGAIVKIITQPLASMAPCTFITKAKAEQIALSAVGANTVLLAVLEKTDTPPDWSVDVVSSSGAEYEVKVNACTGKVITIIIGG